MKCEDCIGYQTGVENYPCSICYDVDSFKPRQKVNTMTLEYNNDDPSIEIHKELGRAMEKFPTWPSDPLHALAVLGEEYGELNKAMLQLIYEPHKTDKDDVRKEAIQTAAMAMRLVMSLDKYEYRPCIQHNQDA